MRGIKWDKIVRRKEMSNWWVRIFKYKKKTCDRRKNLKEVKSEKNVKKEMVKILTMTIFRKRRKSNLLFYRLNTIKMVVYH